MAAAAASPGVKSRALALALLPGAIAACGAPPVEARAVWVAAQAGVGGERTLLVYDRGAMTSRALRPVGGADEPEFADEDFYGIDSIDLIVELDPRGQGALIRSSTGGWEHVLGDSSGRLRAGYLDFEAERTVPLLLPAGRDPIDAGAFAAAGGALWWIEGCPAQLKLVPLSSRVALDVVEVEGKRGAAPLSLALGEGCAERWAAVSASDAPVLFVFEVGPDGERRPAPGGQIAAVRYPMPPSGYDAAPALELLRVGALPTSTPLGASAPACADVGYCTPGVVDPDGEGFTTATADPMCRLWRWSRRTGKGECIADFDAPSALQGSTLIAAVSPEHHVLFDEGLVHLYDRTTGALRSRPLIDRAGVTTIVPSQDGRALALVSLGGPMLRVDARGIELLSVEQRRCASRQRPVVSPSARFAAFTCGASVSVDDGSMVWLAEFVRVSADGLEVFQGVPMWPLAIDDGGNMLMHSWNSAPGGPGSGQLEVPVTPPRNLYVLSSDGVLERIDALEPDPALVFGLQSEQPRWIDARGL